MKTQTKFSLVIIGGIFALLLNLNSAFCANEEFTVTYSESNTDHVGMSSPTVSDVDGDGMKEVFTVGNNGKLYGLNSDGDALLGFPVDLIQLTGKSEGSKNYNHTNQREIPAIGDLDNDGKKEILCVVKFYDNNEEFITRLFVISSVDGTVFSSWPEQGVDIEPSQYGGTYISIIDALKDETNLPEIIVKSDQTYVFSNNGTILFGPFLTSNYMSPISMADLDKDGIDEIVYAKYLSDSWGVEVAKIDGTLLAGWPVEIQYPFLNFSVGDVNHDGELDIVVGSGDETHYSLAVYGSNGNLLTGWPKLLNNVLGYEHTSPVLSDLDGDGLLEIIVAIGVDYHDDNSFGEIYIFHSDGTSAQGWPQIFSRDFINGYVNPTVSDFDGDGEKDIAWLNSRARLYIWKRDGSLFSGFPKDYSESSAFPFYTINNSSVIADMKGDGDLNVIFTKYRRDYQNQNSLMKICIFDFFDGVSGRIDSVHDWVQTGKHENHPNLYENSTTYSLNIGIVGDGSVTRNPDQFRYGYGSVVTLTANSGAESHFDHWSGDLSGNQNPKAITINGDKWVDANFIQNPHIITASAGANGSINPTGQVQVSHGADQTFAMTPNDGYHVLDVLVDGQSVGAVYSYTFNNVTSDHTINALFGINVYHIDAGSNYGGSIDPSGDISVTHGGSQTFTWSSIPGYKLDWLWVDGSNSRPSQNSYTFENVTRDHTIFTQFTQFFVISASAGEHGTISPSGEVEVRKNEDVTFLMTPETGYEVGDVLVDGQSVGAVSSYQFSYVQQSHAISVTFKPIELTISASSGANGSISPSGNVSVNYGESKTFTMTPSYGYHVEKVLVDGVSVGAPASYAFNNVTTNHTISVSYAINVYTITATYGVGGSITPSGAVPVTHGDNKSFTIKAQNYPPQYPEWEIAQIKVDGAPIPITDRKLMTYAFNNVVTDHTIEAFFFKRFEEEPNKKKLP